jgi:hypothetical protein
MTFFGVEEDIKEKRDELNSIMNNLKALEDGAL